MINYKGIWNILKPDCVICNWPLEVAMKTACKSCPFISGSWNTTKKSKYRMPRPAISKDFNGLGIDKYINKLGKHQLYFFLYNPDLNFELPNIPDYDMNDKLTNEHTKWILHHINGNFWDDRQFNLLLCLNNEHGFFEKQIRDAVKNIKLKLTEFIGKRKGV